MGGLWSTDLQVKLAALVLALFDSRKLFPQLLPLVRQLLLSFHQISKDARALQRWKTAGLRHLGFRALSIARSGTVIMYSEIGFNKSRRYLCLPFRV